MADHHDSKKKKYNIIVGCERTSAPVCLCLRCTIIRIIESFDPHTLLIVIFLQIGFQFFRQSQIVDAIVCGMADNSGAAQLLKTEHIAPIQWQC